MQQGMCTHVISLRGLFAAACCSLLDGHTLVERAGFVVRICIPVKGRHGPVCLCIELVLHPGACDH